MSRGLDHIVHAVRDLDAAAALYRGLGFTVGARNRHPPQWGTQNHIIQFPGCFVELLAMADTSDVAPHEPQLFSFGAFNRDFLAHGEGLSMLALASHDAEGDAAQFRAAAIGDYRVFHFERTAQRPDGEAVTVAFSLAFARDPHAPDIGFFACQHLRPENFWNPAFQRHANTASTVAGVVLVAENPVDHHKFLSLFTGERDLHATSSGMTIKTGRGEIQMMTPQAFSDHFDVVPPDVTRGARMAALRIGVRDLGFAEELGRNARLAVLPHKDRLLVGPSAAMGATLVFERI
jgi:hypothetical protein